MRQLLLMGATLILLAACSDKKSEEEQVKDVATTEKVTTEKATTEKPSSEKPSTEEVEKKEGTTEAADNGNYISSDGRIDIESPAFIKDFFFKNNTQSFGGIKIGMPIADVEKMYGKSIGHGVAAQYPTEGRFGDFALDYPDGNVQTILINPHKIFTKEDVIKLYGEPTTVNSDQNNSFVYNGNKNNGYMVIIGFDSNWNVIYLQQLPEEAEAESNGAAELPQDTKTQMVKEFLGWADERAKIGKMAVSDHYFNHGAAGRGDWYANSPDGQIQTQNNDNPGFKGFNIHAIGGVVFYTPVSGNYGWTEEAHRASTAEGYSLNAKRGMNIHKYILADNGKVYELIQKTEESSFSSGFGERDDNGKVGDFTPNADFQISGDEAAQQEWRSILKEYGQL